MARITVVNDYPAFLEMMDALLREDGHEVRGFDGQTATIDEISATRPDLLIIDVMAKGETATGWDVIALARLDDTLKRVPIVVCTATIDQTEARIKELDGLGDIHLLAKPFGAEELQATIGPLLGSGDGTP